MTKLYLLFVTSTLIFSCGSSDVATNQINEEDTINYIQKEINLKELEEEIETKEEKSSALTTFKGNWFDIIYPSTFSSSPSTPIIEVDDYEFVETDEAYFLSADGEVEFFVYSPQWGGNPLIYLDMADNEEIDSEKTTVDEINPNIIVKWVTFKDKNGKYLRSYFSKQTESTHLVFGIKYANQTVYDLYKTDYAAFKKSLIQYAD